jgi:hypothetical protein
MVLALIGCQIHLSRILNFELIFLGTKLRCRRSSLKKSLELWRMDALADLRLERPGIFEKSHRAKLSALGTALIGIYSAGLISYKLVQTAIVRRKSHLPDSLQIFFYLKVKGD